MGFWGSFVVARTPGSLLDLQCVAQRGEGLIEEFRAARWAVGVFEDLDHGDDAESLLAELLAATGAPALVAGAYDSDAIAVAATSPGHGPWRAALAHAALRGLCEDEEEDFDAMYPPPPEAAALAADWARDAQLEPDQPILRAVFDLSDGEPFAESLFFQMLAALGIAIESSPADQTGRS